MALVVVAVAVLCRISLQFLSSFFFLLLLLLLLEDPRILFLPLPLLSPPAPLWPLLLLQLLPQHTVQQGHTTFGLVPAQSEQSRSNITGVGVVVVSVLPVRHIPTILEVFIDDGSRWQRRLASSNPAVIWLSSNWRIFKLLLPVAVAVEVKIDNIGNDLDSSLLDNCNVCNDLRPDCCSNVSLLLSQQQNGQNQNQKYFRRDQGN